jgi:hypothetical protein
MNKRKLKKDAKTEERYNQIMDLRKAKEYDQIFEKYGQNLYNIAVPNSYKRKDIENLLIDGRFEDIYRRYGEAIYNSYIDEMQEMDIYNETGSKPKSILNRIKNTFLHRVAPILLSAAITVPSVTVATIEKCTSDIKKENSIEYMQEIETYNKKISNYANEINSMNLTDIQIFMKVMNDLWSEIDGYGTPETDIQGYYRLSLDSDKRGVCRHMADDVTAKLNAINPEYNARNIIVYLDANEYHLANIERNIIDNNSTVVENEDRDEDENTESKDTTKITGNHMVTAVDIPNENITLILDTTNPGIGVFKNGKIHMFYTKDGSGIEYKMLGQLFQGLQGTIDMGIDTIESFIPTKYSLEELENLYGTDAQNKALEELSEMEKTEEKEDFIPKVSVNEKLAIKKTTEKDSTMNILENEQEIK